jgi:hypothetical protein
MLDLPSETLLGPEVILDHFRVRIHETLETAPYISVVLAFYEKELPRIFPDAEDRDTALRLLKILILGAISPIRRRRTVAQLAEMVLYRVTDLDPAANYDFIRDLLESMRQRGAYISVEGGEHPHQDVYFVDLAADVPLIIQRRVEGLLKDPGFTLGRALEMLLPSFTSTLLPLASLASAPRSTRRISSLLPGRGRSSSFRREIGRESRKAHNDRAGFLRDSNGTSNRWCRAERPSGPPS